MKKHPLNVFMIIVLSAVLIVSPAMAGVTIADNLKDNVKLKYEKLTGTEHEEIVKEALNDRTIHSLLDELVGPNARISKSSAYKIALGKTNGYSVTMYTGDSDNTLIMYGVFDNKIKTGAVVFESSEKARVYDVVDGKIYNTSIEEFVGTKEKPEIKSTYIDGPYAATASSEQTKTSLPKSGSSCSWCTHGCNIIIGLGCGMAAFTRCLLICNVNLVCEGICNALWIVLCYGGTVGVNCPQLCTDMGYC